MKLAAMTNQEQLYAVAVRIGELMKITGIEAAQEKRVLMKLLLELEGKETQLIERK